MASMRIVQALFALLAAVLLAMRLAHGASQAEMVRSCETETWKAELRIAEARKKPEYRTEQGRKSLSTADRWVNHARKHFHKGESRHCLEAANKGRAQLSAR